MFFLENDSIPCGVLVLLAASLTSIELVQVVLYQMMVDIDTQPTAFPLCLMSGVPGVTAAA
jgi:hypothetical protein